MPQPAPRARRPADTHRARWLRDKGLARAEVQCARRFANYYNSLMLEAVALATVASLTAGAAAATAASCEVDGGEGDDSL
jgi:hypothetical protein